MQNNQHLHVFSITANYWRLEGSIQTLWKLEVEILSNQFSSWNYEKTTRVANILNNYVTWQELI